MKKIILNFIILALVFSFGFMNAAYAEKENSTNYQKFEGTVSNVSVKYQSFILKTKEQSLIAVNVLKTTSITKGNSIATFADITVGEKVKAEGQFNPAKKILNAKKVEIEIPILTIGQPYQGGIIAYLFLDNFNQQHGLIATIADISSGAPSNCAGGQYTVTGTAYGTGESNTINLTTDCPNSPNIAAWLAFNLVEGGYSDWYLPSKDELNLLYISKDAIGGFATDRPYWSSSISSFPFTWLQSFDDGYQGENRFITSYYVRAIRSF